MTVGETADEQPFATSFCSKHAISSERPLVILAPFSTAENRSWEPDLAANLADWLTDSYEAHVVMTIAPNELSKAQNILSLSKSGFIIAEGTTVRQYIALLRRSDLVITGDSSPMHLAAALGKPYVALFGPTPFKERAPLIGQGLILHKPILCAPCDRPQCSHPVFRQCMKLIGLSDVQDAVKTLLAGVLSQ